MSVQKGELIVVILTVLGTAIIAAPTGYFLAYTTMLDRIEAIRQDIEDENNKSLVRIQEKIDDLSGAMQINFGALQRLDERSRDIKEKLDRNGVSIDNLENALISMGQRVPIKD